MSKPFTVVPWAQSASVYEVNIRQYTAEGSFQAFAKHLPRLQEMGIDILWLMPVTPISIAERQGSLGSYYACSSYTEINPEFGSKADFQALVEEAHALGMKLIIDWVANHTGYDHHWTKEHPDWYVKDADGNFTERNGWKDVIDLDFTQASMRQAMIASMQYWVKEFDIDGFRCDMAHLVPLDFWMDARTACDTIKPLYWLAECEEIQYHHAFDTSYAWWWMHTTEKFVKGETGLHEIREVLHAYSQYPAGASKLFFTANHDENSWNGTEYEKYANCAKAWAVFTCTWQGVPLIYSGQENPNLKRLAFFDKDLIEWNAEPQLHGFYQRLLQLRKNNFAITRGETFILPTDALPVMAYFRKFEAEVVLVLLNLSNKEKVTVQVNHNWLPGKFRHLFSDLIYAFSDEESYELLPGDYLIYVKQNES
ncbi:alpha-amylase family glycosyl hydrolase [Sediminibacterium goheungense]|uniref:Glycosidase n=1 Tax=Sediminibacterium goheungense TaxID=1086393 RepID=A0A4R6IZM5_9BACT|nr:alpha-amylase family glycosyl hydrolase [Sediminibacterium goheungense]TDO28359.1 glycosidase [Sediminibacterium goheungense]